MNNFIKDDFNNIKGVENEKTLIIEYFTYDNINITVLITKMNKKDSYGERYINVYVLNEYFKIEPLNCLDHQTDIKPIKHFNRKFCEIVALQHYLWFKYGNPSKNKVLSFSIQEHE